MLRTRHAVRLFVLGLVVVVLVLGLSRRTEQAQDGAALRLAAPEFVRVAYAQGDPIGTRLDEEAGISAYFKASTNINLSRVRDRFRVRETDNSDYIIGSVAIPNYPEHYDVHVYVHRTGWVLAYYPQNTPVSKIIDVISQNINVTKLQTALSIIADAAGVPLTNVIYYHFSYPSATHMMLIAEDEADGNDFTIQLPSTYSYFEGSWAVRRLYDQFWDRTTGWLSFDEITSPQTVYDERRTGMYGIITASQLLSANRYHTIRVQNYGVLVLLYRIS